MHLNPTQLLCIFFVQFQEEHQFQQKLDNIKENMQTYHKKIIHLVPIIKVSIFIHLKSQVNCHSAFHSYINIQLSDKSIQSLVPI